MSSSNSNPIFTVSYCRNWDGGGQERDTARSCVSKVFPNAQIINEQTDNYPIKVIVTAKAGKNSYKIWEGRQQALFGKNRSDRDRSIKDMIASLEDLKGTLEK